MKFFLIYCLDIFFNVEYYPSEWYRVLKKSQCVAGSDSDQPVLIRLAKSQSSLVTLWSSKPICGRAG